MRDDLGSLFGTDVDQVTTEQYQAAADDVFADGDLALNVATLVALLRDLDVDGDYPGFVIDELLGRELAGMLAGQQPLRLLGEATFHFADVHVTKARTQATTTSTPPSRQGSRPDSPAGTGPIRRVPSPSSDLYNPRNSHDEWRYTPRITSDSVSTSRRSRAIRGGRVP